MIPKDVTTAARGKYTAAQIKRVDDNIHYYFEPNWSEISWRKTWQLFDATLKFVAERGENK